MVQYDKDGYPLRDQEETNPDLEKFTDEDLAFLAELREMLEEYN